MSSGSGGNPPPVNIPINFVPSTGPDVFDEAKRKADELDRAVAQGDQNAHANHIKELERIRAERQSAWEAIQEGRKAREDAEKSVLEHVTTLGQGMKSVQEWSASVRGDLKEIMSGNIAEGFKGLAEHGKQAWEGWKQAKSAAEAAGLAEYGGVAGGTAGGGVLIGGFAGLAASAASAAVAVTALAASAVVAYEMISGSYGKSGTISGYVTDSVASGAMSVMGMAGTGAGSYLGKGALAAGGGMLGMMMAGPPGAAYGMYQGWQLGGDAEGANKAAEGVTAAEKQRIELREARRLPTALYRMDAAGDASYQNLEDRYTKRSTYDGSSHAARAMSEDAAQYNMLRQRTSDREKEMKELGGQSGLTGADLGVQKQTLLAAQTKDQQEMLKIESQRGDRQRALGEEMLRNKQQEAQAAEHALHLTETKLEREKSAYESAAERLANMGEGGRMEVSSARQRILSGQGTLEDANTYKPFANGETEKDMINAIFERNAQSGGGDSILDPLKQILEETRKKRDAEKKAAEDIAGELKAMPGENEKALRSVEADVAKAVKVALDQIKASMLSMVNAAKDEVTEKFTQGAK